MAIGMFAGALQEGIGSHEEFIFSLAEEDERRFPVLHAIRAAFYDSPRLSAQHAGLLVHELIDLLALHGGAANKPLAAVSIRLLVFFSRTHRAGQETRCRSD